MEPPLVQMGTYVLRRSSQERWSPFALVGEWGLGFGDWGLGFGVEGRWLIFEISGFGVQVSGF